MRVFNFKTELFTFIKNEKAKNKTIGLVPTMGALHEGHLSLVKKAMEENDVVVVSIFVNPTQFDNKDDLDKYPQNFSEDLKTLNTVSEAIIVFAPTKDDIYEGSIASRSYNFEGLEKVMEGEFRTGHFNGVATIVELLLRTVDPNRAYFGEKDFQQLQIIKKLVKNKKLPYQIIACPIEREPNGLARSSRNERLSKKTRQKAALIYKTLSSAKEKFGTKSAKYIKEWVTKVFDENELFKLEYFEITDVDTLTPMIKKQKNRKYRAFIAVYADGIRLIDNIALN
ncbi:MAG: pantoate--beta-alanine ligase [Croceitalea sp.]|nr:pantoate--beta-alanine ligase [Croceitalea sp.]